jgi:protein TonB
MFEFACVEAHGRTARPCTFMVSIAGQLGVIGLSILIPLVFVEAIPQAQWLVQHIPLLLPPGLDVRTEVQLQPSGRQPVVRNNVAPAKLYEPVRYPPRPAILVDPDEAPGAGPASGDRNGVPYGLGDPQGALSDVIAGVLRTPVPAPPPPVVETPAAPVAEPPRLFRIGGNVQAPKPLQTPPPEYPAVARQARIQGVVHLEAIIAADGAIRSVRLVEGPALLVQAAIRAVRSWRYTRPTLNGDPIEILMNVEVKFQLNR